MTDYISRQAAINAIRAVPEGNWSREKYAQEIMKVPPAPTREGAGMKAWKVEDTQSYEGGCTVVFAETRGKAHALARSTDCCEYAEWCDIRVTRIPEMDKMWKSGKVEMDWYNSEDRIALVKECGWFCNHEYLERENDCPECPAVEWCEDYQDWLAGEKEEQE